MPNPTAVPDLEARFRPLTDDEQTVAESLLDDAWAVLLANIPDLESRGLSDDLVRFVVSAMAIRVLRNPNGVRQWSVDDYSETRDSAVSAGMLAPTSDEIALLTGTAGRRRKAFSIEESRPTCPTPGAERDAQELDFLRYGWGGYYQRYLP